MWRYFGCTYSHGFLKNAKNYLQTEVKEETLETVKNIVSDNRKKRFYRLFKVANELNL